MTACGPTALPARLEIPAQAGVETTYQRGAPLLRSKKTNGVILKLIDRDQEELLLGLAVENRQSDSFELSTKDVRITSGHAGGSFAPAHIYAFEELPREETSSLTADGAQAAAGIAALPIGGIWGSLAQSLIRLGVAANQSDEADGAPTKVLVPSLKTAYLQRHTVEPGEEYRGLFIAELSREPEPGDDVRVDVTIGSEAHSFLLRFASP